MSTPQKTLPKTLLEQRFPIDLNQLTPESQATFRAKFPEAAAEHMETTNLRKITTELNKQLDFYLDLLYEEELAKNPIEDEEPDQKTDEPKATPLDPEQVRRKEELRTKIRAELRTMLLNRTAQGAELRNRMRDFLSEQTAKRGPSTLTVIGQDAANLPSAEQLSELLEQHRSTGVPQLQKGYFSLTGLKWHVLDLSISPSSDCILLETHLFALCNTEYAAKQVQQKFIDNFLSKDITASIALTKDVYTPEHEAVLPKREKKDLKKYMVTLTHNSTLEPRLANDSTAPVNRKTGPTV